VTGLTVTGGTVVAREGLRRCDVFLSGGRIVRILPVVRTRETGSGEPGGHSEDGTVGAGAYRSVAGVPVQDDADPVAGGKSPVAGGGPGRRSGAAAAAMSTAGDAAELDATGLLVAPGFLDLQCNGAVGVDLATDPERLWEVAAALPRWGVTAWLPTIVTSVPSVRLRALATWRAGPPPGGVMPVATPLGLHLEGPFLAPAYRGAHDATALTSPSRELIDVEGWSPGEGVALVTLAPELPGAHDVIRVLAARGVVVAAGHSGATTREAAAAVDAGVRYVTHLFNAMAPLHHREPGLAGVALVDERLTAGLIADGLHVDPVAVRMAARILGDRLSLVTDAVSALGAVGILGAAGPGTAPGASPGASPGAAVRLGGTDAAVSPHDGSVRLPDGTLAGSTLSLDRAVRNLVAFAGVTVGDAVASVTATPAVLLGLADRGVVAPGAVGDLVLLTPAGDVVATVVGGRIAHDRRTGA
jgi:N-acetylglucosamine-6-phosphate deacetylase